MIKKYSQEVIFKKYSQEVDSQEEEFIGSKFKKWEAEKRAKLAIEQDLNESKEANLRMAANNQFLK